MESKLHIYLGLFLLLFMWLFGFSGLLLNHHWEFASFWEEGKKSAMKKRFRLVKKGNN